MDEKQVEHIIHGLEPLALVIRSGFDEEGIHFFTPPTLSQQVAFMRHAAGKKIAPHVHNPVTRQVLYTQETLFIRKGRVKVNLYSSGLEHITSLELRTGDVILLCGGGHSFEMLEETSMIEVKQGPYAGQDDKVRFEEEKGK